MMSRGGGGGRRGGGRGRGAGGMDRPQDGDFSYRRDNRERRTGWDVAPRSRHLWVGNLSLRVTENLLAEQFMRFGDLESIAYAPGRSYAFVNFRRDEDAIMAMKTLQDFDLAGGPLRIEFAKPDRTLSSHDDPACNEGKHFVDHGESLVRRDMRLQRPGPERSFDSSRENKSSEPSEMLWIGFPASLDVDDASLRRAFSPFGEIDRITTFPGRSYAFIRYRSIVAACRAKEALQGKLFNNPRVSICFARTDTGLAEHARGSSSASFPSHYKSNFHPDLSGQGVEPFQRERSFGSPIGEYHVASPGFLPNMDRLSGDPNMQEFGRNSVQAGAGPGVNFPGSFEHVRLQDERLERRIAENRVSPILERGEQWHDRSYERPWKTPRREDSWGVEGSSFSLPKKPRADSFPDKELPEYPFNDTKQGKYESGSRTLFPNFPKPHHAYNKNFDPVPIGYKGGPENSRNLTRIHVESIDPWRNSDGFKPGPGPSSLNPVKLEEVNPEPRHSLPKEEWKWEGTIAKGGTSICRARCLPVGKVLDFMLPEIINCTARTDLDMLAKHYYQAANTWVVFFVPENDTDIVSYNEFMHYLGEKQRAAVAKLDEKISLFLVPPSEFSEQVLKVPGKVSISGVILQFQQSGSNANSVHHAPDAMASKPPSFHHGLTDGVGFCEDSRQSSSDIRPITQRQNYFNSSPGLVAPMVSSFPPLYYPGNNHPYSEPVIPKENIPDFRGETRQDQLEHHNPAPPSDWPVYMHSNSSTASIPPVPSNGASHSFDKSMVEEYQFANSTVLHGSTSTNNASEISSASLPANKFPPQQEGKPSIPSSLSLPLQPEQLAQLAALLGQHKKSGTISSTDGGQPSFSQNPSLSQQSSIPSLSVPQFNPMQQLQQYSSTVSADHQQNFQHYSSIVSAEPFNHSQQLQQQSSFSELQANHPEQLTQHASSSSIVQPVGNHRQESNQQASTSNREEAEADPQRRLQATLQLAAALLQQIQQQAKPADQR